MKHEHESDNGGATKSRANMAVIAFLAIAALFLAAEHRAHLSGWLAFWPYLLLLACPLMHLFMHGGHGHGHHASREATNESAKREE